MARETRRIIRNSQLERWMAGLDRFDTPTERDELRWSLVTKLFYLNTQLHVHVITGNLMKSGDHNTIAHGDRITGTVMYGGTPEVNYAAAEFARGGSHNALLIGYRETHGEYQKALRDIMLEHVNSWK